MNMMMMMMMIIRYMAQLCEAVKRPEVREILMTYCCYS